MIAAPGIYENIAMADYLGQLTPAPSISGSGLAEIDAKTPAHWWAGSYMNPEREPLDTDALAFGSATHKYILEGPEAFNAEFRVKPQGMNFATKDGKAWRDNGDKRAIVTLDNYTKIKAMGAALHAKRGTHGLMTGTRAEVTLLREDGIVWTKARPDMMNDRLRIVGNLKTCEDATEEAVRRRIDDFGGTYYVAAALCLDMLKALTGEDWSYVFVFVEKTPPYESRRVVLKPTVIEWGRMRYRRALAKFAHCVKTGVWPGYDDATIEADLPVWAEKRLQARHEAGDFSQEAA